MHIEELLSKVRSEALLTQSEKETRKIFESGKNYIFDFFQPLIQESEENLDLNPDLFKVDVREDWITIYFQHNFIRIFFNPCEIYVEHIMSPFDRLQIQNGKLISNRFQKELSEELLELYLDRLFMDLEKDFILNQ